MIKLTYNCEYEQGTNNIYFSILWDLEILGRPNWESTQLTSIGKQLLSSSSKVWLMPCSKNLLTKQMEVVFSIEHIMLPGSLYTCSYDDDWYFGVANYISVESYDVSN